MSTSRGDYDRDACGRPSSHLGGRRNAKKSQIPTPTATAKESHNPPTRKAPITNPIPRRIFRGSIASPGTRADPSFGQRVTVSLYLPLHSGHIFILTSSEPRTLRGSAGKSQPDLVRPTPRSAA